MKFLTLHEPYATLMAAGLKTVETRSWPVPRTVSLPIPVAIHAALRRPDLLDWEDMLDVLRAEADFSRLRPEHLVALERPFAQSVGKILCIVWLTDCREMTAPPNRLEAYQGTYGIGRYGWVTDPARLIVLPEPIPMAGQRGLRDLPLPVEDVLREVAGAFPG